MLSKKNLVFKKNQTMVALNVHFYSTQSHAFLFMQLTFLRGSGTFKAWGYVSLEQRLAEGFLPDP